MDCTLTALLHDPTLSVSFAILRRTESLVKGRTVSSETEEPATGMVQPATPRELERLPEADRTKSTIIVFTDALLRVGDEAAGSSADGILWNGETYTVTAVENWQQYGFFKALAQKESV